MKWRSICSVTSKSAITPWRSGRVAEICAGVRPIMRCASAPTATTSPVRSSIATTDGSESTMPRPCTWTTVLAVPRSTAMSRADRSTISDKGARRAGELGRCGLRSELPAVLPQRLVLAQREQDPVLCGVVPDVDPRVDDAAEALEHADRRAGVDVLAQDLAGGDVDDPVGPWPARLGRRRSPRDGAWAARTAARRRAPACAACSRGARRSRRCPSFRCRVPRLSWPCAVPPTLRRARALTPGPGARAGPRGRRWGAGL